MPARWLRRPWAHHRSLARFAGGDGARTRAPARACGWCGARTARRCHAGRPSCAWRVPVFPAARAPRRSARGLAVPGCRCHSSGGSFLVDPAEAVSVALGVVGVLTHGEVDPLRLLLGVHGPGPGGDAQRQVVRGHVEGLRYQGLGADDGAGPDDRAVEDDGPRAHETAVLDRAALEVGVVADDAVVPNHGGPLLGGVQDGAVLDRRALAADAVPAVRPKP